MEQARVFIAIALSFLVFFLWEMFFVDKETPPAKAPTQQAQQQTPTDKTPAPVMAPITEATGSPEDNPGQSAPAVSAMRPARSVVVSTPMLRAVISEAGAVFQSIRLMNYQESMEADSKHKELIHDAVNDLVGKVDLADNGIPGLSEAVYQEDSGENEILVTDAPRDVRFTWTSPEGIQVVKRFTFYPDHYLVDVDVSLRNASARGIKDRFRCSLAGVLPEKEQSYGFEGPSALIGGHLEQIKAKQIAKQGTYEGLFTWVAVQDRYFMTALMPPKEETADLHLALEGGTRLRANYVMPEMQLPSGGQADVKFTMFFGPKSVEELASVGHRLDEAIDFGWFDFIAKPCVWFMNFIYGYVPNYGVAIIILTVIMKLLLWPLGNKSYKSMSEMKKLQPLMADIREKYQNDKQRMNQELMGLYKTYKINPMGGCLPMVLQIPVFIALYRMLYEAIELRHAPFIGWINDLSAPDRLFHFSFSVPFMEPPFGVPVLTLVMGATMLLQQKMSPPMGDPTQAKMMMLMPLVFTFIFINFPSGLVLYWLVNNVLSIAQQYYVTRKYA